jgi:hypothetical protein
MGREQKRFDPGFVNCVTHSLTGAQILYHMMHSWNQSEDMPVTLWCRKGDAVAKASTVRVALSKERRDRNVLRTFELRLSEAFPYTHFGIQGEAIVIYRVKGGKMTQLQAAFTAIKTQG